jgi:hypothetical protein
MSAFLIRAMGSMLLIGMSPVNTVGNILKINCNHRPVRQAVKQQPAKPDCPRHHYILM